MKTYQAIPINECQDPLIAIPDTPFAFTQPHPYVKFSAPYGDVSPWSLRQGVLNALLQAQAELDKRKCPVSITLTGRRQLWPGRMTMLFKTARILAYHRASPSCLALSMNSLPTLARWFLVLGALNMALTVGLGAAGMHGLKAQIAANDPGGWFHTALHYHQLHALGLMVIGLAVARLPANRWLASSGMLLLAGIVLFSGNLYLRSIAGVHLFHAVTPLGGGAFILGWLMFALGAWRHSTQNTP
jgi:uncharacterized membrane protein YgdD (TMEM256/DUF423 family)